MNLGGVRVPSNPDLFWRSSMSGLGESLAPPFKGAMRAQSSGCSHFGFRPPEGGTPWVRQVGSSGFSRWGADTSRRVGLFDGNRPAVPSYRIEGDCGRLVG